MKFSHFTDKLACVNKKIPMYHIFTFNNLAAKHLFINSKDSTSDRTEFPPAFGTSRIRSAPSVRDIRFTPRVERKSQYAIPPESMSLMSL